MYRRRRRALLGTVATTVVGAAVAALLAVDLTAQADEPSRNLIGNGDFEWSEKLDPLVWQCSDAVRVMPPPYATDFVQVDPDWDPVPPSPGPSVPPAPPSAMRSTGGAEMPPARSTFLLGEPTATDRAQCEQHVPVRPSSTYTLSAWVAGGPVTLGTEYGRVHYPGDPQLAPQYTLIKTTFVTGPRDHHVRVRMHGVRNMPAYQMDAVSLDGPGSRTVRPDRPAQLRADVVTSRTVWLSWASSPGATSYQVYMDGKRYAEVTTNRFRIRGLSPDAQHRFHIRAKNPAGVSALSQALSVRTLEASPAPPEATCGSCDLAQWHDERSTLVRLVWTPMPGTTDGHFVYVDGVRVGWSYNNRASVPGLTPGPHTVQFSSLNSAGESELSDAISIIV